MEKHYLAYGKEDPAVKLQESCSWRNADCYLLGNILDRATQSTLFLLTVRTIQHESFKPSTRGDQLVS